MSDVNEEEMVRAMVEADDRQTGFERCRHMLRAALSVARQAVRPEVARSGSQGVVMDETLEPDVLTISMCIQLKKTPNEAAKEIVRLIREGKIPTPVPAQGVVPLWSFNSDDELIDHMRMLVTEYANKPNHELTADAIALAEKVRAALLAVMGGREKQ